MTRAGRTHGYLAALSHQAVRWAARFPQPAPGSLRRRLYDFHRLPISPAWASRLRDRRAVVRFLGADREAPAGWRARPLHASSGWIGFERLEPGAHRPAQMPAGPFKLYVSPRPRDLPVVLESLWPLLARQPVTAMKIADSASGLLRPDKLVIYSPRLEWIEKLARDLLAELGSVPAHGVPFSAEVGGRGLLSWGADRHLGRHVSSWRSWLVRRLADALCRSSGPRRRTTPRWRHALRALQLEGVDIERWQPRSRLWRPPD